MLQKRAEAKYHSGGLWSNTCCGHPQADERLDVAVHRRLKEEMGFDCELKEILSFTYKTKLSNVLIENEFDHVFIGFVDNLVITPNPNEVSEHKWLKLDELRKNLQRVPQEYTKWLKIILAIKTFNEMVK